MSIDIQGRMDAAFRKVLDDGYTTHKIDRDRVLYLRPSSFSYCPLATFLNFPVSLSKSQPNNFSTTFFTRVGTVTHEIWQETFLSVFGQSGSVRLIRDWVCLKCKERVPLRYSAPKSCKSCGTNRFKSDEHEIRTKSLSGHVDDILVFVVDRKKYAVVIDYKSTSTYKIDKKKIGSDPSYEAQISSYATLVEPKLAKLGITLAGWCLAYFTRDNPFRFKLVSGTKRMPVSQLRSWAAQHKFVLDLTNWEEVQALVANRCCKTVKDASRLHPHCRHATFCTGGEKRASAHAKTVWLAVEPKTPVRAYLKKER